MSGQTSVNPIGQPIAFAGLISDNAVTDLLSGFSEEATAEIPFGVGIAQGSAPQGVLLPAASGDKIKGIVAHTYEAAPGVFGNLGDVGVKPNFAVRVLTRGRIWVTLDQGLAAAGSLSPNVDRGFVRYETDGAGNTIAGRWWKVTDGHNIDLTKATLFRSGVQTAADGTLIAEIDVDFVNKP